MYLTAPDNFLYVCFMLVSGNKCTPYVVPGTYLASHLDKRVSSNAMINCVNSSVLCRHPSNDIQFPRQSNSPIETTQNQSTAAPTEPDQSPRA